MPPTEQCRPTRSPANQRMPGIAIVAHLDVNAMIARSSSSRSWTSRAAPAGREAAMCGNIAAHSLGATSAARRRIGRLSPGATMITGKTTLVAHLGYPTEAFKAPMIYNPYFEKAGVDAVVVPMGVKAEDYPAFLKELFKLANIRG